MIEGLAAMQLCAEHSNGRGVVRLDDRTIASFLTAERAALVVAASDSRWCEEYLAGIDIAMSRGEMGALPIGVVVIDQLGAEEFVRSSDWIAEAAGLPFTALYRAGQRIDGFIAFSVSSLLDRLNYLAFLHQPAPRIQQRSTRLAA